MPVKYELVKPEFREVERMPSGHPDDIEDMRTLWRGDPTEHWIPHDPVDPKDEPRPKRALRKLMARILTQLPEKLLHKKPQEIGSGENECVVRINGVHRDVLAFNAVITLRYWPRTSTLEAELLVRDGAYDPADRYTDRTTFTARTKEETENLIYQVVKYLYSRVPW